MLWSLRNSPERALKLLDASIAAPSLRPSRHVVEDCLNYLTTLYLKNKSPDPLMVETLFRLVRNFAEASDRKPVGFSSFPQPAVYLLLQHCSGQETEGLFEMLCRQNAVIHPNTALQFLKRFVEMGNIERPLEILRNLVVTGAEFSWDIYQSACAKLLRGPFQAENRYNIQSSILAQILEAGIRPGIFMYNVIILNAIEAGDYQTAWQMYDMTCDNGLRRDAVTYSIMLKGAKNSLDSAIVDRVVNDAEEDGYLPQDERLVRDLLDAIFVRESSRSTKTVFDTLLRTYTRYCHLGPLQDLDLVSENASTPLEPRRRVHPPSSWTVGLMVLAYIKQHQDSDFLPQRYLRYHKLVLQGHSIVAPTARREYVYNAFIMALGRKPFLLGWCVTVVKDMLPSSGPSHNAKPTNIAIPTVQTWSILTAAYFYHKQTLAAQKVLKMMEARGLPRTNVTWNTIINGYSNLQDADRVVKAMKQMEAAGFEADAHTLKALGRFRDRNHILEALKKAAETGDEEDDQASNIDSPTEERAVAVTQ